MIYHVCWCFEPWNAVTIRGLKPHNARQRKKPGRYKAEPGFSLALFVAASASVKRVRGSERTSCRNQAPALTSSNSFCISAEGCAVASDTATIRMQEKMNAGSSS